MEQESIRMNDDGTIEPQPRLDDIKLFKSEGYKELKKSVECYVDSRRRT